MTSAGWVSNGSEPGAARSKGKELMRRVVSSTLLWGVVLWALLSEPGLTSDLLFVTVLGALGVFGILEAQMMLKRISGRSFPVLSALGTVGIIGSAFVGLALLERPLHEVASFELTGVIVFALVLMTRCLLRGNGANLLTAGGTVFAVLYVAVLINFLQKIRFFPEIEAGGLFLLYFIVVTKLSDTGAYAVGSVIGRHKMIPRVSPGKTWEGLGGAILFAVGGSLLFVVLSGEHLAAMLWGHALALGALLGAGAVIGDLIESLFKREAGLKDSGYWFPGIGGVLDLLDSLLFNAPLMYWYLIVVLT